MRRLFLLVALAAAAISTPASAQDDQAACLAQMQAVVRPLLERASQFSPDGVRGQGFAPLARPFAPYAAPYPAPPTMAPPTAAYNWSARYTGLGGLPQPGTFTSQQLIPFLVQCGQINLNNPVGANAGLLVALASLQHTEQAPQQ